MTRVHIHKASVYTAWDKYYTCATVTTKHANWLQVSPRYGVCSTIHHSLPPGPVFGHPPGLPGGLGANAKSTGCELPLPLANGEEVLMLTEMHQSHYILKKQLIQSERQMAQVNQVETN